MKSKVEDLQDEKDKHELNNVIKPNIEAMHTIGTRIDRILKNES